MLAIASLLHSTNRAHATILFKALTPRDDQVAGTLVRSREQAAEHNGIGASDNSFGDITRVLDAAIANNWNIIATRNQGTVIDSRNLGHTHT